MSVDGARNLAGVTAQALNKRAGTQFVLVPSVNINNGLQDTITGRTQAGIFSASIVEAHVNSGALRAFATASTRRLVAAPEVPAAAETLPGFDFSGWFMVMAPTGTPRTSSRSSMRPSMRRRAIRKCASLRRSWGSSSIRRVPARRRRGGFSKDQLALWAKTTQELGIEPQ